MPNIGRIIANNQFKCKVFDDLGRGRAQNRSQIKQRVFFFLKKKLLSIHASPHTLYIKALPIIY